MSRVLVTGAAGFVGANLVRRLLADGSQVVAAVHKGASPWRLRDLRTDVQCLEGDVRDPQAVAALVAASRPETIFHLAANGAYAWQQDRDQILETNFTGTVNLIEAALRYDVRRIVLAGTSSEYGYRDHGPNENEAPEPNSYYAVAKAAATLFAGYVGRTEEIGVGVVRLYSAYGPWEEPGRLVPALVAHARSGRLPSLASPDVARDFVYVTDACDAFVRVATALRSPGDAGIYNVGSGRQTTLAEIVDVVRRQFGIDEEPRWNTMAERSWDTNVWVADPTRIRNDLGWIPTVSLAEGIAATARWMEESPTALEQYQSGLLAG
jgi:dolichol-phosphate mannosyltransferase